MKRKDKKKEQKSSGFELPGGDGNSRPAMMLLIYAVVAVALIAGFQLLIGGPAAESRPYSEFLSLVEEGEVTKATISSRQVTWFTLDSEGNEAPHVSQRPPNVNNSDLPQFLRDNGVQFTGNPPNEFWNNVLSWLIPIAAILLIGRFMLGRMSTGAQQALQIGKNKAQIFDQGDVDVTYEDVGGVDEAVNELKEIVDFLKTPEKYERLGGRVPKGVLLVGPPGTGKTLLGRATAGEADVPFFSLSGAEFVEMFAGVGAARVRDLFKQAREQAPCIVFIDELDTIGRTRSGSQSPMRHEEREQTLHQLLVEMDGFDSSTGVIIMAATNRPDVLDPALLRPGRFDRQVVVDRPGRKGRREILDIHANDVVLDDDVDLDTVAARTPGFAGAELENLVNEAALLAARRGGEAVTMDDFDEAIDRVMMGLEKESRALNEHEQEVVAHHEMGHAMVASLLPNTDPVHKVSIVPRGQGALGMTAQLPVEDRYLISETELHDRLAVMLGGRAAEEIIYGVISTGASDDLQKVTDLTRRMVTEFGMSPQIGPVALRRRTEKRQYIPGMEQYRSYGEDVERTIDEEVKRIVEQNYARAIRVLEGNREALESLASELLDAEEMDGDRLEGRLEELDAQGLEATPHSLSERTEAGSYQPFSPTQAQASDR